MYKSGEWGGQLSLLYQGCYDAINYVGRLGLKERENRK